MSSAPLELNTDCDRTYYVLSLIANFTHYNPSPYIYFFSDSDRVDDLMDAMQDEKDIHDQISDAISRGHGDALDDVRATPSFFKPFSVNQHIDRTISNFAIV